MTTATLAQKDTADRLPDVGETALLTLFCRAIESQSPDPILKDEKAVEIARALAPELANADSVLLRKLASGRLDPRLVVHIALRAQKYDQYAADFLARRPGGMVVNIGCGMDSRFFRIDDGRSQFFDLDLPEMIAYKKRFYQENERYHMIAASALDFEWMDTVLQHGAGPVMFIAEGVLMYLEAEQVKALVVELSRRFPGSELVCEVVNAWWLRGWRKNMLNRKLRQQVKMGKDAEFTFGVEDEHHMERWAKGIHFLDEWSYFDSKHRKLGPLRWFGMSNFMRKVQWTVHYRFE